MEIRKFLEKNLQIIAIGIILVLAGIYLGYGCYMGYDNSIWNIPMECFP